MNIEIKVGNRQLSHQIFVDRANKVHNYKYDYSLSVYTKMCHNIIIICPLHGEFIQIADKHVNRGSGCPKCSMKLVGESKRVKLEDFIIRACKIHNNKYDYKLADYTSTHKKLIIICPIHGNFMQAPSNHLSGKGCTKCKYTTIANKAKLNLEDFVLKSQNIWGDKFDYTKSKYLGCTTKLLIKCKKHNLEFEQTPNSHYLRSGCDLCLVRSRGEEAISKWLINNEIQHETEKQFIGCKIPNTRNPLRFDFYIEKFNLLIEYDGKQHYDSSCIWGPQRCHDFESIKARDLFKTKWAKDNGYFLVRIPYFDFKKIDSILSDKILIST